MPDVLSSLAAANGSHESFHSSHSSPADVTSSQKAVDVHSAALQAAGLPVYDVEAFLNDPNNQLLLQDPGRAKKGKAPTLRKNSATGIGSSAPEPVQLGGTKTSHHVKLLNELCQSCGLQAEFEIEGDQSPFGGSLSINGETISTEEKWRSKKEAREELAEKGMEIAQRMAQISRPAVAPTATNPQINWIGRLLEYFNATSPTQGPVYTDFGVGKSFACTCVIPGDSTVYGGTMNVFPTKKAAQVNAAREAMQSLISAGLVESDGSLKVKKKVKCGTAVKVEGGGLGVNKNTSYAQRVNDIYPILGLPPPTYDFKALNPLATNILSGAATFTSPLFPKPLGEVRNVYGKKNAREECAKGVWVALSALAASRGIKIDEMGEDDEMDN